MKFVLSKKIVPISVVFFAVPFFVNAQSFELTMLPIAPEPNQLVTVSLSSLGLDLNNTEISWYKDGKIEKKGLGVKNFNFTVGEKGSVVKSVLKVNNQLFEKSIQVNPSSVDLLWETIGSYDPPFYKGKILPIKTSFVRVVAIPQQKGTTGFIPDPKTFVYSWEKDGSNFAGQSGYGKNSFTYTSQVLDRTNTVVVKASGIAKQISKSLTISPYQSEVHFYEYSTAYGPLYNRAIKTTQSFSQNKITILAEPYFIFAEDIDDPTLITEWKVNGRVVTTDQKNILSLSVADNVNFVDLSFTTDNKDQLLQAMTRLLRLTILR